MIKTTKKISALQAAKTLNIDVSTIHKYIRLGKLRDYSDFYKQGRGHKSILDLAEVKRFKKNNPDIKKRSDRIKSGKGFERKYVHNTELIEDLDFSFFKPCPICGEPMFYDREKCPACKCKCK